jgi:uncharacterized protein (TIGR02646 family)
MLKVQRPSLSADLQTRLNQALEDDSSWEDFGKTQTYDELKALLQAIFHEKCAYCEAAGAEFVEHHWPKSPHSHNANRGTKARMFLWENLLLACNGCNGFGGKAAHMKWTPTGSPMLLNPCLEADDPLCYFEIALDASPAFVVGWIDPQPDLDALARQRAEYTIMRLKLNVREHLVRGRKKNIQQFYLLMHFLQEFGPDYEAPSGHKIRDWFVELLSAKESFLAPIRQILYHEPAYAHWEQQLLTAIPELQPILTAWAFPLPDCSHTA